MSDCKVAGTLIGVAVAALLLGLVPFARAGHAQDPSASSASRTTAHPGDVAEIGAKLSNPVSDVWALFTEFDLYFSDGDLNRGASEVGGRMIFQPVLPFPLHGSGEREWKRGLGCLPAVLLRDRLPGRWE